MNKFLKFFISLCVAQAGMCHTRLYANTEKKILLIELHQEIDPRTSRYMELALKQAIDIGAEKIIIDIDTYGGTLDDADKIRTAILKCKRPVYVFINKNAASAGALISIACDSIYMASGASIGAATVVNGDDGQAAPDKYQSYMRGMMRSTAEANKRNPRMAEAMVDPSAKLDTNIKKDGKVLTFTTREAIVHGFCEAEVNSVQEIIERTKSSGYEVEKYELPWSEKIIALFLNPAISGILILIILGGLYFEMQSPGIGFPLIAAIVAAALYFTPYYLNGLAANWEMLVFLAGILLIGLEIFVIPGFGVVGILGIVLTFASLVLVMLNNTYFNFDLVQTGDLYSATVAVLAAMLASGLLVLFGAERIVYSKRFKKIALQATMDPSDARKTVLKRHFIGKIGIASTVLRPSGKIKIDEETYDAVAQDVFIEKGSVVVVYEDNGSYLKVKPVDND